MKYVVGLTGGIGSGKSAVADQFAVRGIAVIDTDRIAHELTASAGAAMPKIQQRFGASFVTADGALDRPRMRELAFRDPQARRDLEAILHPMIRARAQEQIDAAISAYVVLVVPLLLESADYRNRVNRVLVVDCDEDTQIERVRRRSGLETSQIRAIIDAQIPRTQRLALADDVILNDRSLADLPIQVEQLHARYLSLAGHV